MKPLEMMRKQDEENYDYYMGNLQLAQELEYKLPGLIRAAPVGDPQPVGDQVRVFT